jgi:hypothetical protein
MITYQNSTNEAFYDFEMLMNILRVPPSYLKRVIKNYGFSEMDFIKYKNRHLYRQNAVIDFVVYLVSEKLKTELHKMEKAVDKF